jgi:acetolactate synthase-1/2/3 large subunit
MLGHNRKKMLGAECMADMLKGYGVTHVFHVPAVLRRSFVEMERRTDIKRLHVHGENPPPTWRTATRAPRENPASAWRR